MDELESADCYLLMSLIYQDLVFTVLTFEQAEKYYNYGADVFHYHFDVLPRIDWLLGAKPAYDGLGNDSRL